MDTRNVLPGVEQLTTFVGPQTLCLPTHGRTNPLPALHLAAAVITYNASECLADALSPPMPGMTRHVNNAEDDTQKTMDRREETDARAVPSEASSLVPCILLLINCEDYQEGLGLEMCKVVGWDSSMQVHHDWRPEITGEPMPAPCSCMQQ